MQRLLILVHPDHINCDFSEITHLYKTSKRRFHSSFITQPKVVINIFERRLLRVTSHHVCLISINYVIAKLQMFTKFIVFSFFIKLVWASLPMSTTQKTSNSKKNQQFQCLMTPIKKHNKQLSNSSHLYQWMKDNNISKKPESFVFGVGQQVSWQTKFQYFSVVVKCLANGSLRDNHT